MKRHDYGAGYRLNAAVKHPTRALRRAARIGVLTHIEEDFPESKAKEAMLVVSYGAADEAAYEASIAATLEAIEEAHPGVTIAQAFTSDVMIRRFAASTGIRLPRPEAALEGLAARGFTRVALVSLVIGLARQGMTVFQAYRRRFRKLVLGTPLMYWMAQEDQRDDVAAFVAALRTEFPPRAPDEAILLMAHGTPHPANAYYAVIQDGINKMQLKNTFIYTVEGWPSLEDVIPELKAKGIKSVTLMPMMMVAGDHANNDMAGDDPDSHKSVLMKAGFKVNTYIHGLGENKAIRSLFVERANESWDMLEAK